MERPERFLGEVIDGRYRLTDFIGSGSFGSVFAADELTLGRVISRVAVKLIMPESPEQRRSVLNEIVSLARLHHDYIIVYRSSGEVAYGALAGAIFFATELGDTSFAHLISNHDRLSAEQLRELVRGIASALAHIHAHGGVHGDVKPANIVRVKGRWKLADLGLLRSARKRHGGPVQGSLSFLAPEMLRNEITPPSDIYSLGVTILFALTGRYAHAGESRAEFMENLRTVPATIPDGVPEPWNALLARLLHTEPAYRMTAVEIESYLTDENSELPPLPSSEIVTVDAEGSGDFSSIQEAIDHASPGARILVRPGKYRDSLHIDKAVQLVGDGPAEEIIVSVRDARCLEIAALGPILIRGLTLRCRPGQDEEESYALDIASGRPVIEECFITSTSLACISVHDDADAFFRDCAIGGSQDAGVFVYANGRGFFDDCRIAGNAEAGVTVGEGARAVFKSCEICENQGGGAFLFKGGVARFEECQVHGNAKAGIAIAGGARGEIKRCQITRNSGEGIVLQDGAIADVSGSNLANNSKGAWRIPERCKLVENENEE